MVSSCLISSIVILGCVGVGQYAVCVLPDLSICITFGCRLVLVILVLVIICLSLRRGVIACLHILIEQSGLLGKNESAPLKDYRTANSVN